jgi:hypothetical protein
LRAEFGSAGQSHSGTGWPSTRVRSARRRRGEPGRTAAGRKLLHPGVAHTVVQGTSRTEIIAAALESSLTHKPAEAPLTREEGNARILTEWNGRNVKELMARYGLSRSAVYAIVGK